MSGPDQTPLEATVQAHYATFNDRFDAALADAATHQPVPKDAPMKKASAYHLLGRRTPRFDGAAIVTGFVFNNPNAKGACGCGESFTV